MSQEEFEPGDAVYITGGTHEGKEATVEIETHPAVGYVSVSFMGGEEAQIDREWVARKAKWCGVGSVARGEWSYGTHKMITRIPEQVGQAWERAYGLRLQNKQYIEARSRSDGAHEGTGLPCRALLAKDEKGRYLLLENPAQYGRDVNPTR